MKKLKQNAGPFWRAAFFLTLAAVAILSLWPGDEGPAGTGWDKADHVLAFIALAIMGRRGFPARPFVLLGLALLAYGGLIEILQGMTPDRHAEWADLAADGVGIVAGGAMAYWWRQHAKNTTPP